MEYYHVILGDQNLQEGFVPKNYVKEIEPAVIKNVTKRKVMKPEKVKLRKKRTEKQRMPKTVRRSALCMCLLVYVCILHILVLWGYISSLHIHIKA